MHDIRFIRDNPAAFDAGLQRRGLSPLSSQILEIDKTVRYNQGLIEAARAKKNQTAKQIGELKRQGQDIKELLERLSLDNAVSEATIEVEQKYRQELQTLLSTIPNLPAADTPDGKDEHDNKELRRFGQPNHHSSARQHFELGEDLGLMDFATAAKLSGARFTMLKGQLARLERALANFMLDVHTTEFGYTEISPPLMVRDEIMYGTGQLPKFREDQFLVNTGHWLIPTAEVPLTNIVNDSIVDADDLPLRFVAKTPCFRAEAGAAGKDTRGMLRQHQFYKVELVSITTPDKSEAEHERMTECAETILNRLELPFRTIVLCTGDMGFSARKTYDIEVWMPGQNTYREISSCSNCGDFQARRMNARYRTGEKGTEFLHTLNGSGVAVGRCLIAIMENFQQPDGSITIPHVLRPYMGGAEHIERLGAAA